jgi:hypothetical protein|uniref:Uncharacterized protein n=1 Tax=Eutreptiella gymnastica TaxID=73025 RepID=A0A7S4FRF6_9EUGL|mmetsp:Transcript_26620/g.45190  ORF Transcript_26620/g.45190 Transcript_26620/m.45190 type:complete len:125 (-) Transcript_26620:186-560(-)
MLYQAAIWHGNLHMSAATCIASRFYSLGVIHPKFFFRSLHSDVLNYSVPVQTYRMCPTTRLLIDLQGWNHRDVVFFLWLVAFRMLCALGSVALLHLSFEVVFPDDAVPKSCTVHNALLHECRCK